MFCRIATIRNQSVKVKAIKQMIGLGDVMAMSPCQRKAQGIAQTISHDVDFTTKTTATASQSLSTVFSRHLLRRDALEQSCCQSSHFPYQDHWQSLPSSVATHQRCTSEQIGCKSCSIRHTSQVIIAIASHYGSPILWLRRRSDT